MDECDCLAFKGSIKQATILNTANQVQEESKHILQDVDREEIVQIDVLSKNLLNECAIFCVNEVKRIILSEIYPT